MSDFENESIDPEELTDDELIDRIRPALKEAHESDHDLGAGADALLQEIKDRGIEDRLDYDVEPDPRSL